MGSLSGKFRKTHQPIDLRKKIVSAVTRASQIFLVAAVIGSYVSTAHSQDDGGRVWVLPFEVTALLLIIAAAGTIALALFRDDDGEEGP